MKKTIAILAFIVMMTAFYSCTKHAGDTAEETIPTATITFSSPTQGAVYQKGDSILIQGTAISTETIHGYEVSIRNAADTAVLYYAEHVHDHNDTIVIDKKWKNTLTTATNLQVAVTVTLDHDGHTSTKTVGIKTVN